MSLQQFSVVPVSLNRSSIDLNVLEVRQHRSVPLPETKEGEGSDRRLQLARLKLKRLKARRSWDFQELQG